MAVASKKASDFRDTKRLKPEERTRIILESAKSILIDEGYSALSLRYVAEKSGIRLATLQYYFPTREKLFSAAFGDAIAEEWTRIEALIEGAGSSPQQQLEGMLTGFVRSSRNDNIAGVFFELWSRSRLDESVSSLMHEFYDDIVGLVAELIRKCNNSVSRRESRQRATMIMAMVEGLTVIGSVYRVRDKRTPVSERIAVKQLLRVALKEVE